MKRWLIAMTLGLSVGAGCTSETEPAATETAPPTPAAKESAAAPVQAPAKVPAVEPAKLSATQELTKYCRVCVMDKGERIEEYFPSRLDTKHKGKEYKFCTDDCKKKFDANPGRYALK